jgi:hypothetical protein
LNLKFLVFFLNTLSHILVYCLFFVFRLTSNGLQLTLSLILILNVIRSRLINDKGLRGLMILWVNLLIGIIISSCNLIEIWIPNLAYRSIILYFYIRLAFDVSIWSILRICSICCMFRTVFTQSSLFRFQIFCTSRTLFRLRFMLYKVLLDSQYLLIHLLIFWSLIPYKRVESLFFILEKSIIERFFEVLILINIR